MSDRRRQARLRERANELPPETFRGAGADAPAAGPRDPPATLEPLRRLVGPLSIWLLAWSLAAPGFTGQGLSASLTAVPGLILGALAWAARRPERRRVALLLATATSGFLALATVGTPSALLSPTGPPWQLLATPFAGLLGSLVFLLRAAPTWRDFNRENQRWRALERLRQEL